MRGDLSAFEALVARYQRRANAVAYRLLNNADDAMEVVQDAFVKAYENLHTLRYPRRFGAWLMRIVSNEALNRRRGRALRKTVSLDGVGPGDGRPAPVVDTKGVSPVDAAVTGELKDVIAGAIEKLPAMQRDVVVLFCIGQMPQKDVAEILGCSVQTVKWHVFEARKALKEILVDYL